MPNSSAYRPNFEHHKTGYHMPRPGFSICVCPDIQLTKNYINSLLQENPAPEGAWEKHVYWSDEGLPPVFWENLTLQGLFASPKVLMIRNAQNLPIDAWRKLSTSLGQYNPLAWVIIFLEAPYDRGKPKIPAAIKKLPCWKLAETKAWIWQSAGLTERAMRGFIEQWAAQNHIQIEPKIVHALSQVLPQDASAAKNELEKLALAAGDARIIADEHIKDISHDADMDIFAFINALQSGKTPDKVWNKVLSSQAAGDAMIFSFLAMLLREARILWQLYAGETVRLPSGIVQQKKRLATNLGPVRLSKIWDLALEAEMGIKTGERKPEQAMEILVAGLLALFSPKK
ncbi:DNA polymerase III subunit delta [Halodesulfovibrio sp.]|jgi:DNA polymerase-3 subunit delta|uniref:DNA polymerase III subunit delta n=1 Tax=Halodesulfovibrio sp. TaxID=1912772 RepID=UPI0025D22EC6|nr:DNA polymerase III subunit delta [Halodesulfovibrio sp.]MCT4536170.1 DNA polymerase III subunit delta [Halodesulfovibrio sp.]